MEKLNEAYGEGNAYDFGERMYDGRICRWMSIDPMAGHSPWQAPYCYGANRPIDGVDYKGKDWIPYAMAQDLVAEHNLKNGTNWTVDEALKAKGYSVHTTISGEKLVFRPGEGQANKMSWSETVGANTYEVFNVKAFHSSDKLEVLGRKGSSQVFNANSNGMVELPADNPSARNGQYTIDGDQLYQTYNRNDNPSGQQDQWGPTKGIAGLINGILDYQNSYPGEQLQIGDLNSPNKAAINFAPGKTHHGGSMQADIRLLTTTGGSKSGFWNSMGFDPKRSAVFFDAMKDNGFNQVLLFGKAMKQVGNTNIQKVNRTDHEDHYHFQSFK